MRNSNITSRSNDVFGSRQDRAIVAGVRVGVTALARSLSFGCLHSMAAGFATALTRYWPTAAMATTKRMKRCAVLVAVPRVGRQVRPAPWLSVERT